MPFSNKDHSFVSVMYCGMIDERRTGFGTPYKFNAKELDCESGYYYYVNELVEDIEMSSERVKRSTSPAVPSIRDEERMRSRYYDPRMSRFLSVDPLASDMPAWGSFTYTFDNPIRLVDPTGMRPEGIILTGIKKERKMLLNELLKLTDEFCTFITLGHELKHARDILKGEFSNKDLEVFDFDTQRLMRMPSREYNARGYENTLRDENNVPLRALPIIMPNK